VREVHVWCGKSWGGGDRPKDTPPVPAGLHYDLWLGPAPQRPYHPAYVPFNWRRWWDFGGGTLADMACHYVDLPFWALGLRHPTRVAAEGATPVNPETAAPWLIVRYAFPARGELPAVLLTWYDGGKRPAAFAEGKLPKWGDGVLFVGAKGMLLADYNKHRLLPEADFAGYAPPAPSIPKSVGHHREWVEACKTGGPTTCNFDYAGALTEAVLLGNVSYRLGNKPLEWDAKHLRVTNEPEAEKLIRWEYRKPWTL
jgi:predicted dehydrogenase